jgi:small GTP-binding protein
MRLVSHDYQFKIVLTGDCYVGKTCIIKRFLGEFYSKTQLATMDVNFIEKDYDVKGTSVMLHIWDTAGAEKFRSISTSYYRNSIGIVIVFDVSNRKSFNNLSSWLADAKELAPKNSHIVIVGNKSDLPEDQWTVSKRELEKFSKDNECECLFTSAHANYNISKIFYDITEAVLNKITSGLINTTTLGYSDAGIYAYTKSRLHIQEPEIEIKKSDCVC